MSGRDGAKPARGYERIYAVVRRIPRGRVATYGQVATIAGLRGHARQVGYALHALPSHSAVPWQRVVNAKGMISLGSRVGGDVMQRLLLEREGVEFDAAGRIRLNAFGWKPRVAARSRGTAKGRRTSRGGSR